MTTAPTSCESCNSQVATGSYRLEYGETDYPEGGVTASDTMRLCVDCVAGAERNEHGDVLSVTEDYEDEVELIDRLIAICRLTLAEPSNDTWTITDAKREIEQLERLKGLAITGLQGRARERSRHDRLRRSVRFLPGPRRPRESSLMSTQYCQGCDNYHDDVSAYVVKIDSQPEPIECQYCSDCAELAAMNWNGETESVEPRAERR